MGGELFIDRPAERKARKKKRRSAASKREKCLRATAPWGSGNAYYSEDVAILKAEYESLGVYFGD